MLIGVKPVITHNASFEIVRYALTILMFINLCILISLALWQDLFSTFFHTGAPYSNSGKNPPICIYVCTYIYVCVCVYVCVCGVCVCLCVCVVYVCVCLCVCVVYVCVCVCLCVCVVCVCLCVCGVCMYVYVCVCVCVYMYFFKYLFTTCSIT